MELNQYKLSALLSEVLGPGTLKNDESIHYCPVCHHHKQKLQVNLTTQKFHCWTCDFRGTSVSSLFKNKAVNATPSQKQRLYALFPAKIKRVSKPSFTPFAPTIPLPVDSLALPPEFVPLWSTKNTKSILRKNALFYLKKRGITPLDIIKHNIGFCETGEYRNRVILPSYDKDAMLNFYTGRNIFDADFMPYKNPVWSKDIVGFELFINWKEPLVICEGPMDALAIKRNAVPLYGKTISPLLSLRILEHKVSTIYLALDNDALKTALRFAKTLMGQGVRVFVPEFVEKDPSKLGFVKTTEILNRTKEMDFSKFMTMKFQE